jgi:putative ABC transport system permease protein
MLSTHLIMTLRVLNKHRLFAVVNIAGLATGMAACLLILQYVRYEMSYDRQSPHAAHIWRAFNETLPDKGPVTGDANTHPALGPALKADLPEVVEFTRMFNHGDGEATVVHNNEPLHFSGFWMADPGFLRMFPQRFIAGAPDACLREPYTIVLAESAARRIFGEENPLGKGLRIPGGTFSGQYTVTGITADPPPNTHLKYQALISYSTRIAKGQEEAWYNYWEYNYFQLVPGADPAKVQRQLDRYSEQHLKEQGIRLLMQPFTDIHLHSNLTYEIEPNGSARTVYFLLLIAIAVLGIALINYVNLATAGSLSRAKEVGMRKALGAGKIQLIGQFLSEGALLNSAALLLCLFLVQSAMPWFEALTGKPISAVHGWDAGFWSATAALYLFGIAAACTYPAFFMSRFRPTEVLKGGFRNTPRGLTLRKGLVVLQFACSTALLVGVIATGEQVRFLNKHELGLSLDQIVTLKTPAVDWAADTTLRHNWQAFKTQAGQLSGIQSVTASSVTPGLGIATIGGSNSGMFWVEKPELAAQTTVYFWQVDDQFFNTFGIKLLAGELPPATDGAMRHDAVAINESALRMFGFGSPEEALGKAVAFRDNPEQRITVTGVVADFHIESLKTGPRPTLYYHSPAMTWGYLSLKTAPGNVGATLSALGQAWGKLFPESPFEYVFLDEQFAQQYRLEQQFARIFGIFAGLTVFVACLGLFGLAAFAATRRTKEIGIRKVLGASVAGITGLLAKDFLKLVLLAFVIAAPAAWYFLQKWLAGFAYRIELQWWMFALAGITALAVAFLTVSFQSIKAALANPVESLRSE